MLGQHRAAGTHRQHRRSGTHRRQRRVGASQQHRRLDAHRQHWSLDAHRRCRRLGAPRRSWRFETRPRRRTALARRRGPGPRRDAATKCLSRPGHAAHARSPTRPQVARDHHGGVGGGGDGHQCADRALRPPSSRAGRDDRLRDARRRRRRAARHGSRCRGDPLAGGLHGRGGVLPARSVGGLGVARRGGAGTTGRPGGGAAGARGRPRRRDRSRCRGPGARRGTDRRCGAGGRGLGRPRLGGHHRPCPVARRRERPDRCFTPARGRTTSRRLGRTEKLTARGTARDRFVQRDRHARRADARWIRRAGRADAVRPVRRVRQAGDGRRPDDFQRPTSGGSLARDAGWILTRVAQSGSGAQRPRLVLRGGRVHGDT